MDWWWCILVLVFAALVAGFFLISRCVAGRKSLRDKVVLITGAGGGIGRELSLEFARQHCHVICVGRHAGNTAETVELIKKLHTSEPAAAATTDVSAPPASPQRVATRYRALAFTCDVSNAAQVERLGEQVHAHFDAVDILVNNAGVLPTGLLINQSVNVIRQTLDINLNAHFWTLKAFLPKMWKNNQGHIVAVSSMYGLIGGGSVVPYCATKFAVVGLMEALRAEFKANGVNIKTLCVNPGFVNTGMLPDTFTKGGGIRILNGVPVVILSPRAVAVDTILALKQDIQMITIPRVFKHLIDAMKCMLPDFMYDFFIRGSLLNYQSYFEKHFEHHAQPPNTPVEHHWSIS